MIVSVLTDRSAALSSYRIDLIALYSIQTILHVKVVRVIKRGFWERKVQENETDDL